MISSNLLVRNELLVVPPRLNVQHLLDRLALTLMGAMGPGRRPMTRAALAAGLREAASTVPKPPWVGSQLHWWPVLLLVPAVEIVIMLLHEESLLLLPLPHESFLVQLLLVPVRTPRAMRSILFLSVLLGARAELLVMKGVRGERPVGWVLMKEQRGLRRTTGSRVGPRDIRSSPAIA